MSALLDGILQDSPTTFVNGIIQRFVAIRLPILACLLNSIKLIQRIINIVFEKNIVNKIDRIILAVDFHFCITERVIIIGACAAFDSKNFMGFAVGFAWQIEHCTGIKADSMQALTTSLTGDSAAS